MVIPHENCRVIKSSRRFGLVRTLVKQYTVEGLMQDWWYTGSNTAPTRKKCDRPRQGPKTIQLLRATTELVFTGIPMFRSGLNSWKTQKNANSYLKHWKEGRLWRVKALTKQASSLIWCCTNIGLSLQKGTISWRYSNGTTRRASVQRLSHHGLPLRDRCLKGEAQCTMEEWGVEQGPWVGGMCTKRGVSGNRPRKERAVG